MLPVSSSEHQHLYRDTMRELHELEQTFAHDIFLMCSHTDNQATGRARSHFVYTYGIYGKVMFNVLNRSRALRHSLD